MLNHSIGIIRLQLLRQWDGMLLGHTKLEGTVRYLGIKVWNQASVSQISTRFERGLKRVGFLFCDDSAGYRRETAL